IPLAITHAAAYIKTRAPTITISDYLQLFRESEANQVRLLGKKEWKDLRRDHSIRHAVITTWQISFTQIQKMERSAADLLALMSMFDKQGIPKFLLQNDGNQLDFEDALAPLLSFSFVRAETGKQSFEMHRLVQLSMRTWLKAEKELGKWMKESIRTLIAVFPSGDYETWANCRLLFPHAREAISYVTGSEDDLLNQAKIAFRTGWYLYLRGEYEAAKGVFCMSVEAREKVLGPEHPHTLTSVSNLGLVLERQGKYKEAEAMHQRALEGHEKVLGLEHPDTLTSVNNLGWVLESQGKYEEAEAMHRRVLEGSEKILGPEHPDTLTSVYHLAFLFHRQQKYSAASKLYQRAHTGYIRALGVHHPTTIACFNHYKSIGEEIEH
ncbi:putative kinesin, partial [Zopfia rhizophila CBS 207.26]